MVGSGLDFSAAETAPSASVLRDFFLNQWKIAIKLVRYASCVFLIGPKKSSPEGRI
jgi:hypothetical protein